MNRRTSIIIGALLLLTIAAGAGFFETVRQTFRYVSEQVVLPKQPPKPPAPEAPPGVNIYKSADGRTLYINWSNLPIDTVRLDIFRKGQRTKGQWLAWKTISTRGIRNGTAEIQLGQGESADDYSYFAQSTSVGGQTTWTSPESTPQGPPPQGTTPTPTSTVTVTDPGQTPTSTNTSTPPTTPPPPNPTSTNTSTPPTTPPPPNPTSTGQSTSAPAYYGPDGQIIGYYVPNLANFWVIHVDKRIQIGWQNINPATSRAVVLRSPNENGPWTILIDLNNPPIIGPYVFNLTDETLRMDRHYKLEARSSGGLLQEYGPIFLPALAD